MGENTPTSFSDEKELLCSKKRHKKTILNLSPGRFQLSELDKNAPNKQEFLRHHSHDGRKPSTSETLECRSWVVAFACFLIWVR